MKTNITNNNEINNASNNNKINSNIMKKRNFLRNVSAIIIALFTVLGLGLTMVSCESGIPGMEEVEKPVNRDRESKFFEYITVTGEGSNEINAKDSLGYDCFINGVREDGISKVVNFSARVATSGKNVLVSKDGSFPTLQYNAGEFKSGSRADSYDFGSFQINNTFSKVNVSLNNCSGESKDMEVGYLDASFERVPMTSAGRDTIVGDIKYNIYNAGLIIRDHSHKDRQYDAVFEIPFLVLVPYGTVVVNYDSFETWKWQDHCEGFYNWGIYLWNSAKGKDSKISKEARVPYVREGVLEGVPAIIDITAGQALAFYVENNGAPVAQTALAGNQGDSISWNVLKQNYRITGSASFTGYFNYSFLYSWGIASKEAGHPSNVKVIYNKTGEETSTTNNEGQTVKTTPIEIMMIGDTESCTIIAKANSILRETTGGSTEKDLLIKNQTLLCESGQVRFDRWLYTNKSAGTYTSKTINTTKARFTWSAPGTFYITQTTALVYSKINDLTNSSNGTTSENGVSLSFRKGTKGIAYTNGAVISPWTFENTTMSYTEDGMTVALDAYAESLEHISTTVAPSTQVITYNNEQWNAKQVTVVARGSHGTCNKEYTATGWQLISKVVTEDEITYDYRNNRVTGVYDGYFTVSLDEVKYVNGVETSVTARDAQGSWGYSQPSDQMFDVKSFIVNGAAYQASTWNLNGYRYTTTFRTNANIDGKSVNNAAFNFNFWSDKVTMTLPNGTVVEYANLKDVANISDKGLNNPLENISDKSKGLYSYVKFSVAQFNYNKDLQGYAVLNLVNETPIGNASLIPQVSWDYNNGHHVTVAVIQDGFLEIYLDPKGKAAEPVVQVPVSSLRIDPTGKAIAAYQTANGDWHSAIVQAGTSCTEYYALETSKYVEGQPNRRILDNHAHTKWGGHKWSGFISNETANSNGTYTIKGYVQLLSVDDNVKEVKNFEFTTKN